LSYGGGVFHYFYGGWEKIMDESRVGVVLNVIYIF
jgi:hypothetical protein